MRLLLLVSLFFNALVLYAQVEVEIEEVLVEAEADNEAFKEQKNAGTSKLVASSKDLNSFGHHAAGDVLKRMPRIFVQGPPSFNRNIMMAGLDKQFQSILINGNRPAGGEDYRDLKLDRIPVDMIDKIEIIYNPPAIYGADATIGLVNLVLKDTPEKRLVNADIALDRTSTHSGLNPNATLAYGNKWNKWSVYTSYSVKRFKRENKMQLTDSLVSGTANELLDVWVNGFTGTVSFKPDSTQKFKLQSFLSDYKEEAFFIGDVKRRTKGGLSVAADTADDIKHRQLHSHTFEYHKKWKKAALKTGLNFAQHFDSKDRWRWRESSEGIETSYEDEFQNNAETLVFGEISNKIGQGNIQHAIKKGARASFLNRKYDRYVYTKLNDRLFWDDITNGSYKLNEYQYSIYISDEITINKLWVMPALRFNYDAFSFSTQEKSGSNAYKNVNPSVHTKYKLSKSLFLKADIARQISRSPYNLMVPIDKIKNKKQLIERGNENLIPSTALNTSFSIEKYFGTDNFVGVRSFYTVLRNVIETQEVGVDDNYGYRIFQSVNVDSGLVWGVDASLRWSIFKESVHQLVLNGNVSWLGSEVRDAGTHLLRRLNEQPQWISNISIDYLNTKLKIQCSLGINHVGERYISKTIDEGAVVDKTTYAPFTQIDARIKYFYSTKGSIYINAVNMLNEYVSVNQGFVTEKEYVGCNIIIGANYRF